MYTRTDYTQLKINKECKLKLDDITEEQSRSIPRVIKYLIDKYSDKFSLDSEIVQYPRFKNKEVESIRMYKAEIPKLKAMSARQYRPMYQMMEIIIELEHSCDHQMTREMAKKEEREKKEFQKVYEL